jgi:hypothetical protein
MASLATMYRGFLEAAGVVENRPVAAAAAAAADPYLLRALPNEDVYLFVKRDFENARVVRAVDPAAGGTCWRAIAVTGLAALMLIALLLPGAYRLLAGYRIHQLQIEREVLIKERAALQLEEARLLNPARLEELARIQEFIDPAPERVQHLAPKGEVASLNQGPAGK